MASKTLSYSVLLATTLFIILSTPTTTMPHGLILTCVDFTCATGDCGRLKCHGAGGAGPTTLAQFSFHHGANDFFAYGVSFVDGFNVAMTVTPHEGKGVCPVVGCRKDLLAMCSPALQVRSPLGHELVVACKSGCEAFGTDELCCRNHFNSPHTCMPSAYSLFFKHECPATFTYAHDSPSQ